MCIGGGTTKFVYHERQLGALCGVHCVNNLLQGPRFGPGDLAEIGVRLDRKERRLLAGSSGGAASCRSVKEAPERSDVAASGAQPAPPGASGGNFDGEPDGGNFSVQVLHVALARAGLQLLPSSHPHGRELLDEHYAHGESSISAFVVQRRNHWLALRAVGPCWWNLDSLLEQPKPLDAPALKSWLRQLHAPQRTGKGCLFLVRSDTGRLPAPFPPQAECGNWHQVGTLLETSSVVFEPWDSLEASANGAKVQDGVGTVAASPGEYGKVGDVEMRAALALVGGNMTAAADAAKRARRSAGRLLQASADEAAAEAAAVAEAAEAAGDQFEDLFTIPPGDAALASPPVATEYRLAKALPAQVAAVLKARKTLPEAVARLVALLCVPSREELEGAANLVDYRALADMLLTALTRKAKGCLWTEGLADAATVAVELLLSVPPAAEGAGAEEVEPESASPGRKLKKSSSRRGSGASARDTSGHVQNSGRGEASNGHGAVADSGAASRSPSTHPRSPKRPARRAGGGADAVGGRGGEASSGSGASCSSPKRTGAGIPGGATVAAAVNKLGSPRCKSVRRRTSSSTVSKKGLLVAAVGGGARGDEFEALDDLLSASLTGDDSPPFHRPSVSDPGLRCATVPKAPRAPKICKAAA